MVNMELGKIKPRLEEVERDVMRFLSTPAAKKYLRNASPQQLKEIPSILYNSCLQMEPNYQHLDLLKFITYGDADISVPSNFSDKDSDAYFDELSKESKSISKRVASNLRSTLLIEEIPDNILLKDVIQK